MAKDGMMETRNEKYNADGSIDCELLMGEAWIPFTARADDSEQLGQKVFAHAQNQSLAPYVPPEPEPEPTEQEKLEAERAGMVVSRFQAKAALLEAGKLDIVEQAVTSGTVQTQLAWAEAVEFRRNSPTIATLAAAVGLTDTEVDDLFRAAAEIEA